MKNRTALIKITKNYQVTLPAKLRNVFKLKEGDYLEARIENGAFVFSPKRIVDIDPDQSWFWDKEWQKEEKEVNKEIKQGGMKIFTDTEAFINDLNK